MMDAVDTALGFGMSAREMDFDYQPFPPETLYDSEHAGGAAFLSFVNAWIELAGMLNELSRSCLLYTSPSPRDRTRSRMPSSA